MQIEYRYTTIYNEQNKAENQKTSCKIYKTYTHTSLYRKPVYRVVSVNVIVLLSQYLHREILTP